MTDGKTLESYDTIAGRIIDDLKKIIASDEPEAQKLISYTTTLLSKLTLSRKRITKINGSKK